MVDSSQRNHKEALSSLLKLQEKVSSFSETQATLTSQIALMSEKLNAKDKLQTQTKQTTKPVHSIHRKAIATSNNFSMDATQNETGQRKHRKRTTKHLSSVYHNALATLKDFPINHFVKQKENTSKNMKSRSVPHSEMILRKMQLQENITESDTFCNDTLFRLELQLDDFAWQTSFILMNTETGNIIANKTFNENDSFKDTTFEICLIDGPYLFMLIDLWADGIKCSKSFSDGLPCYNIYMNDELAIPGSPFHTFMNSHEFDTRSLCLTDNLVIYELNIDIANMQAEEISTVHPKITNTQTKEEVKFLPVSAQNENVNKTSFFQCLPPSMYDLKLSFSEIDREFSCDGPCFTISVNDKIIIQGKNSFESAFHRFFITVDGVGREQTCRSNPPLAPVNKLGRFAFDERVSNILDVLQALSNVQDIYTRGTSQNQAACYILNDDPLQIHVEDPMLIQRYALAVFLFSINEKAEVQISLNACVNNKIGCNEQGDIDSLVWSEYIKSVYLFVIDNLLVFSIVNLISSRLILSHCTIT